MYLSYKIKYRHEQQTIAEWHTVEVIDDGRNVKNKNGVIIGIGPFLRLEHVLHENQERPNK